MILLNELITAIRTSKKYSTKKVFIKINPSNFCQEFLQILLREGFIKGFQISKKENTLGISIEFRFDENGKNIIRNIKFIGSNLLATNLSINALWKKQKGEGVFILATSKGLLTDQEARLKNCGGKLISIIV